MACAGIMSNTRLFVHRSRLNSALKYRVCVCQLRNAAGLRSRWILILEDEAHSFLNHEKPHRRPLLILHDLR
jgi:hypothetical protein